MSTGRDGVFSGSVDGDPARFDTGSPRLGAPSLLAVLTLLVAACGPPPEARIEASDRLDGKPPPSLEPTASFGSALEGATPDADELLAEADALRARAEALRVRAQALSSDPDALP